MTDKTPPCRAASPDGQPCVRLRGHKYGEFSTHNHHVDADGCEFKGGIRTRAYWYTADNGYMSEADYQTWGRL